MDYGSFDEFHFPSLLSVGLRNQVWGSEGLEVGAKAGPEFHPKLDLCGDFFVCG